MKYSIPNNKTTKEKEWRRILRTLTGYEACNVDMTIQFIYSHSADTYKFKPDSSYNELLELYKKIGIADNKATVDTFFTAEEHNADTYKDELQALWRTLQLLSTAHRRPSIQLTYLRWKNENTTYKPIIIKECMKSAKENKRDEDADKEGKVQEKASLPLVDKNSPYYEYVSGTVYEEMYNLYNNIRNKDDHSLKGVTLLEEDLEKLLYKMQLQYIRRNNQGSYIPMTKDECKEILNLHNECLKSLTRLYTDDAIYYECKNLTTLLTQNRNRLKTFAQEKLPPLAKVMRSALKPTIELTERSQNKIGANMSSREAVEYTDEQGVIHRGFFTENVYETSRQDDITAAIKNFKKQYPKYEKEFDIIFPDEKAPDRMANVNKIFAIRDCLRSHENKRAQKLYEEFIDNTKWSSEKVKDDEAFRNMLIQLINDIIPARKANQHGILKSSGITAGDELASRASAMSDVALALGFPELLIESRNVTVKIGDKTIDGVMMEGAAPDMKDPSHIKTDDPFFSKKIIDQMDSPEILSSFANLQILDFLCGNTDRHMGNFFWKQDLSDPENPKLLGIQGIDNDTSFGAIKDGGNMKLAYHDNLKIITPEMADAVDKLSKYNLYMLLQPYSLRKEQVEAAEARLELLHKLIENGRKEEKMQFDKKGKLINGDMSIHIVKPDEWKKLTAYKLEPAGGAERKLKDNTTIDNANIFAIPVMYNLAFSKKFYRETFFGDKNKDNEPIIYNKQEPKKPENPELPQKPEAPVPDYKALLAYHKEEVKRLIRIKHTLFINGGNAFDKRSEEFKKMYQALDIYIGRYTELRQILKTETKVPVNKDIYGNKSIKKGIEKEMNLARFYENMSADREQLDTLINDYLNRPRHVRGKTQNRIDSARDLKEFLSSKKESQKIYDNYAKAKSEFIEKNSYTPDKDFKQVNYALNQIFSTMKFTLIDNLNTLPSNNIIRANGDKVASSLERLWNYSMNSVNNSVAAFKTPEIKEGMSDEQHAKELSSLIKLQHDISLPDVANKEFDKLVMKQIIEDLKGILAYETLLNNTKTIEEIVAEKEAKAQEKLKAQIDPEAFTNNLKKLIEANDKDVTITPAQVRNVLHNLYSRELAIADKLKLAKQKKEPNQVPKKNKGKNIRQIRK